RMNYTMSRCRTGTSLRDTSNMKTRFLISAGTHAWLAIAAGIICPPTAHAQVGAPRYEADLTWPKPLPDRWVLGGLGGVCAGAQEHVLILNPQDGVDGAVDA